MPRFEKNGLTVEASTPREIAQLRAQGFREVKAEKPKPAVKSDTK